MQQHRRPVDARRPPVVRDRRRPDAPAARCYLANALPRSNNIGQGAPHARLGTATTCSSSTARLPGPARPPGSSSAPRTRSPGLGTCDEGIMGNVEVSPVATTRRDRPGRRSRSRPPRLRDPRRRVALEDPDRPLLPGRVRRRRSRTSATRAGCAASTCRSPTSATTRRSAPARTSRRSRSTRPATSTRSGSRRPSTPAGNIGDTSLVYAYSTDEGNHWSAPVTIPTPGLANNVMPGPPPATPAASTSSGTAPPRTSTSSERACPAGRRRRGGPDPVNGSWSLYLTQTMNGHAAPSTFTDADRRGRAPGAARQHRSATVRRALEQPARDEPHARRLLPGADRQQGRGEHHLLGLHELLNGHRRTRCSSARSAAPASTRARRRRATRSS